MTTTPQRRRRLNQDVAERIKPSDKPQVIEDPLLPGFALRVQPTGRKSWVLRYVKPNGQRTTKTVGKLPLDTYSMALETAKAILRGEDPFAEAEPAPEPTPPLTFKGYLDDYYAKYLRQHHSRPDETLAYLKAMKLGDKALNEITLGDAESYRLDRKTENKAATTINREMATLKAALQRAVDWDLLPANPLVKLKPLKTDRRGVVRYLDDKESKRLQQALKARDERKREERISANAWRTERGYELLPALGTYCDSLTPMVVIALNTGLRRGELWNLAWGDVDLKRSMLTVRGEGAKSGQTRHIPLNDAAVVALQTHKGDPTPLPSLPVFGRHEVKTSFAGVLKAAKIENFRWHDLRHTFASRLVSAGVPLNTVRELMGHASLDMTLIYAHLAPDNLRAAVDLLGGAS